MLNVAVLSSVMIRRAAQLAATTILRGLPGQFSWFAHSALLIVARVIQVLFHVALAPANAALSLLAAAYQIAFATAADVSHVVAIYVSHWV